jgi:hypothetical protein
VATFRSAIYTRDGTWFGAHLSVNVSQEKETPAGHTRHTDKPSTVAATDVQISRIILGENIH